MKRKDFELNWCPVWRRLKVFYNIRASEDTLRNEMIRQICEKCQEAICFEDMNVWGKEQMIERIRRKYE